MSYAERRVFRPILAEGDAEADASPQLQQLKNTIVQVASAGPLELCRSLRQLADSAESSNDGIEGISDLRLAVAASVLADLCEQEWEVLLQGRDITIAPPDWSRSASYSAEQIKSRIRNGLQVASDRQIASEPVQRFLAAMEQPRIYRDRVTSIGNLIEDGRDLFGRLKSLVAARRDDRERALNKLIRPYIQICADGEVCEFTGLPLLDVWRYFRHTWSLEYNPLPGRTLRVLVRNAARPDHPIIGISMLASPAANMYVRDGWIGWRLEDVVSGLSDGSIDALELGKALWKTICDAIADIRSDDLISARELKSPTEETIFKLRQIAGLAFGKRRRDLQDFEADDGQFQGVIDIRAFSRKPIDWKRLSETPLFMRKRAEQLIPLLRAYSYMKKADFDKVPDAAVYESLVSREGRSVVSFVLNEIRKRKLATEVADLSVCGAVAPYTHLLGGKLVALIMASEEVRQAYSKRYKTQESEIASQMAGRPIIRPSNLSILTTTSLYGISSSQYNRLNLKDVGVRWDYIGETKGITITHLSRTTVNMMKKLGALEYGVKRINSVFGEGSSPKTRQIREGLNLIGINNDNVLSQSIGRRVYACEIYPGAKRLLLGLKSQGSAKPTKAKNIAAAWIGRWVVDRILNPDVLERVRQATPELFSRQFKDRQLRGALTDVDISSGEIDISDSI